METIQSIGNILVWVAGVAGAIGSLYGMVVRPIRKLTESVNVIKDDTGDLMGDRLSQAHDYWLHKGYCPKSDKERLSAMHTRYKSMGRNHLAEKYEQDLLELPEEPVKGM